MLSPPRLIISCGGLRCGSSRAHPSSPGRRCAASPPCRLPLRGRWVTEVSLHHVVAAGENLADCPYRQRADSMRPTRAGGTAVPTAKGRPDTGQVPAGKVRMVERCQHGGRRRTWCRARTRLAAAPGRVETRARTWVNRRCTGLVRLSAAPIGTRASPEYVPQKRQSRSNHLPRAKNDPLCTLSISSSAELEAGHNGSGRVDHDEV